MRFHQGAGVNFTGYESNTERELVGFYKSSGQCALVCTGSVSRSTPHSRFGLTAGVRDLRP
jgi:hypothetical protein